MIGIDITHISRFKNKNYDFAKKILSNEELAEFMSIDSDQKSLYLAKMWSIKEAIFKADNSFFKFSKINLVKKNNKWSFLNFEISVSHDGDILVSVVIKRKEEHNECKN